MMDPPHCNNSNNIHVTEAQLYNHSTQMPNKSRCNSITESGCFTFDHGYSSFQPESPEQNLSMCNKKLEQNIGYIQSPGPVPNGPLLQGYYQHVDPMQNSQQNGLINTPPLPRYSGQGGTMRFSHSGEAVDDFQRPDMIPSGPLCMHGMQNGYNKSESPQRCSGQSGLLRSSYSGEVADEYHRREHTPNGPPLTPFPQNSYQSHVQNGHVNSRSPQRCSEQGGPLHFSYSGEAVDDDQRPEPIANGTPLTPNPQNGYQRCMQNGPTSPRPPPVVRKHSSFLRQNAIEEEEDDNRDELNDSGFGSMCRTTSWDQFRRSRSKDVSDAPEDDDNNNNLAPRRLQRSHSSQEKTDNELAQYIEKRRCSSEQLQRSNGSSGYFSANSVQGEVTKGDGFKPDDLPKSAAPTEILSTASAEDADEDYMNIPFNMYGLKERLNACKPDRWEAEELHEEITSTSDPAVQELLARELLCQLMKRLSMEALLGDFQIEKPSTAQDAELNFVNVQSKATDTVNHRTPAHGNLDEIFQELKSTTSREQVEDGKNLSAYVPKHAEELCFSPSGTLDEQQHVDDTGKDNAPNQVPKVVISRAPMGTHGDTLDEETRNNLQNLLEMRAYCEAMEQHTTCLKCEMMEPYQRYLKRCYDSENMLDNCSDCREVVRAYWNHSQDCRSDRCPLPFCSYFKDLCRETGILHDPEMQDFEGAFGCLVRHREIKVLETLNRLKQLQDPALDEEKAWSADANAECYLREGQRDCRVTNVGRLCKFGRFTPIVCYVSRPEKAGCDVVIKKIRNYPSLRSTLEGLHRETRPLLEDIISTCLWYRQVDAEKKLLVCSRFLSEKSLSSCLEIYRCSDDALEEYWKKACDAAVELHAAGILYLNWKVDHVVVTSDKGVKLCNLDYAVDISTVKGPLSEKERPTPVPEHVRAGLDPRIAPPEVLHGGNLVRKSDTWGLGCLLYQLYNGGCLPYRDLSHCSDDEIRNERLKDGHSTHVHIPGSAKKSKIKLLSEICWKDNQEERKLPGHLFKCIEMYNTKMAEGAYTCS